MYIEISKFPLKREYCQWLEQYLSNCLHQNKSELTLKNYRSDCQKFLVWYQLSQHKALRKITADDITAYRKFLMNGGKLYFDTPAPQKIWWKIKSFFRPQLIERKQVAYIQNPLKIASTKRHLSSVKNFMEYLKQTYEEQRIFNINPVKTKLHQVKLKDKDVDHTKMLTKEDWGQIQQNCWNAEDKLLTGLLYFGGLRLDEIRRLKFENFNIPEGSLNFIRKGGSSHHLKLKNSDYLMKLLKNHQELKRFNSEFVFTSKRKALYGHKAMYNKIMKILKKSGCSKQLTPHSFRKACATNLYLRHKDLLLVRDYLNHKDAKVTQTYIDNDVLAKDAHKRL